MTPASITTLQLLPSSAYRLELSFPGGAVSAQYLATTDRSGKVTELYNPAVGVVKLQDHLAKTQEDIVVVSYPEKMFNWNLTLALV